MVTINLRAHAGGDSYACRAGEVAAKVGWRARWINNNLFNNLKTKGLSDEQCEASMEQIRKDLAQAHVNALEGATPDSPRVLTADVISNFHKSVFDENGAGDIFGGDTLGKGKLGRGIINLISPWCVAPSCRL